MAATALIALLPLLLITALAVSIDSPGPALFRQRRVGRDGRAFDMLKFRSMAMARRRRGRADAAWAGPGSPPEASRVSTVGPGCGRFLRRRSLDELPQLLNVLKGDMSLVGPRPERPEFAERIRCRLCPAMTTATA